MHTYAYNFKVLTKRSYDIQVTEHIRHPDCGLSSVFQQRKHVLFGEVVDSKAGAEKTQIRCILQDKCSKEKASSKVQKLT